MFKYIVSSILILLLCLSTNALADSDTYMHWLLGGTSVSTSDCTGDCAGGTTEGTSDNLIGVDIGHYFKTKYLDYGAFVGVADAYEGGNASGIDKYYQIGVSLRKRFSKSFSIIGSYGNMHYDTSINYNSDTKVDGSDNLNYFSIGSQFKINPVSSVNVVYKKGDGSIVMSGFNPGTSAPVNFNVNQDVSIVSVEWVIKFYKKNSMVKTAEVKK